MKRTLLFCIIGTVLERYDFAVFGVLSPILSKIFFPQQDRTTALLLTFSIFATGFITRPLGGIVFGHIGDKYGRKRAIILSVFLMTISTTCIGLLPTSQHQSYLLITLLIVLRLLQGFCLSGEYAGMFTFIGECAPKERFFFYESFVCFGTYSGFLLGTIIASLTLTLYHDDHGVSQAWRVPFLISIFLGGIGLYLRLKAVESPIFQKMQAAKEVVNLPVAYLFRRYLLVTLFLILLMVVEAAGPDYVLIYYPAFINKVSKGHHYLNIVMIGLILLIALTPVMGWLATRKNIIQLISIGLIAWIVLPVPALLLAGFNPSHFALLGQILAFVPMIFLEPLLPPIAALLFPTKIRYTGIAFVINAVVCVFGGTAPLVSLWLVKATKIIYLPAVYISLLGVVSLIIWLMRQKIIPSQYDKITY